MGSWSCEKQRIIGETENRYLLGKYCSTGVRGGAEEISSVRTKGFSSKNLLQLENDP